MPSTRTRRLARPASLISAVVLAGSISGCGSSDDSSAAGSPPSPTVSAPTGTSAGVLGIRDPWVKAADNGMTAAFGTFVNDGDADVTIASAATEVSPMELHEMAMQDGKMVMQAKPGGIVIKANSSHVLEPGGDHLMLMDLKQPVRAGDEVTFTLTFGDGRTQTFTAVAKPFTGAQESYAPGHGTPETPASPSPAS
ncbi:copper chaperone PCu(A)C [Micromonospora sp. DT48]|uniref:copper chaperone PCu(A)C n=1 Tax=unclassified Micromonospora TaxID=2617518 RepID=UPI0012BD4EAF|nr:copper chaperone PCu(A)C [Micromonospora sp. CP22]MTK03434.1 copper chaperone PCu(A)C [Micromonospora sp. CP22]